MKKITAVMVGMSLIGCQNISSSSCSDDDRNISFEDRVARIKGTDYACTVFRIGKNNTFLTAGHCIEDALYNNYCSNNKGTSKEIFVEFRVPFSDQDGTLNDALDENTYKVDLKSISCERDGAPFDWAVFTVLPNEKTNNLPNQVYGNGFEITTRLPSMNSDVSVTGYGEAADDFSHIQQIATGKINNFHQVKGIDQVRHDAFTAKGVSGGPILHNKKVIGIHSAGLTCFHAGTPIKSPKLFQVLKSLNEI